MANWIESEFGLAALYTLVVEDVVLWGLLGLILALHWQPPLTVGLCMFAVYLVGLLATVAAFVGLFKDQKRQVAIAALALGICNAFICAYPLVPFFV
jgi:hypothetical protein